MVIKAIRHLTRLGCIVFVALLMLVASQTTPTAEEAVLELTPEWKYVSDRVMGGISNGSLDVTTENGPSAVRLTGQVSLENNGGFVQMAFDVNADGSPMDASQWSGIEVDLRGNGEAYDVRLRTTDLTRPWQSYRVEVIAPTRWTSLRIPFDAFRPHRTDAPLALARLRRVGILAIGRSFSADITVTGVRFFR